MMTSKECNFSKEFSPIELKTPASKVWPTSGRPHPRPRPHLRLLQPRPNWQKRPKRPPGKR
eukprot:04027.XXX_196777_196959_1 [CDS] Oithona nana genome sequencing.